MKVKNIETFTQASRGFESRAIVHVDTRIGRNLYSANEDNFVQSQPVALTFHEGNKTATSLVSA